MESRLLIRDEDLKKINGFVNEDQKKIRGLEV